MGREELRLRKNWQTLSGSLAILAEQGFFNTLEYLFEGTSYRVVDKPKEFSRIYENWPLSKEEEQQIYDPGITYRHGFQPDYSIENSATGRKIFVEIKRQDGWVEGLPRSAGRGNAHERLCKYFTPRTQKCCWGGKQNRTWPSVLGCLCWQHNQRPLPS